MKKTHLLPLTALVLAPAYGVAQDKYTTCVNYYTSGDATCPAAPSNALLVPSQVTNTAPRLLAPAADSTPPADPMEAQVDKYLENYGKPPREFVEFYLNPTQENAMKWVATYQQMLKRGQALSQNWNQADELYSQGGYGNISNSISSLPPVPTLPGTVSGPASLAPATVPQVSQQPDSPPASASSIGAFASTAASPVSDIGGVPVPVTLSYYFSATCPYCEKMTPELNEIENKMKSELKLTCIDLTPLGPTVRADPANIASKLGCQWRMPQEGEVEKLNIQQTPTLLIQRGSEAPVRLSGYVPQAQLESYITGKARP
jgi:protein-disulfide isomerase